MVLCDVIYCKSPRCSRNAKQPSFARPQRGGDAGRVVALDVVLPAAARGPTQLRSASTRRRRRWGSGLARHELSGGSGSAACYRLVPLLEPLTRMRVPKTLKLPAHAGHIVLETQVIEPILELELGRCCGSSNFLLHRLEHVGACCKWKQFHCFVKHVKQSGRDHQQFRSIGPAPTNS